MQIFFRTRTLARQAKFGRMIDNGPDAPQGKRFARELVTVAKNPVKKGSK